MMMINYKPQELIALRKAQLDRQLKQTEEEIVADFRSVFQSSQPSRNKVELFTNNASKVWTVVDSAWAGYKLVRRFGSLFRRSKR